MSEIAPIASTPVPCFFCGAPGVKRCGTCREARYCSAEHQLAHWPEHKAECRRHDQRRCEACDRPATLECNKCHAEFYCGHDHRLRRWPHHQHDCRAPECLSDLPPLAEVCGNPTVCAAHVEACLARGDSVNVECLPYDTHLHGDSVDTPLVEALRNSGPGALDAIRLLLARRANVNQKRVSLGPCKSPLEFCQNAAQMRLLLDAKAVPSSRHLSSLVVHGFGRLSERPILPGIRMLLDARADPFGIGDQPGTVHHDRRPLQTVAHTLGAKRHNASPDMARVRAMLEAEDKAVLVHMSVCISVHIEIPPLVAIVLSYICRSS